MSTELERIEQLRLSLIDALDEAQHGFEAAALKGPGILATFAIAQNAWRLLACAKRIPGTFQPGYRASFGALLLATRELAGEIDDRRMQGGWDIETLERWRDRARRLRDAIAWFEGPEGYENPIALLREWAEHELTGKQRALLLLLLCDGPASVADAEARTGSADIKTLQRDLNKKLEPQSWSITRRGGLMRLERL